MYLNKKNKSFVESESTGGGSVRDVDLIPMINVVFLLLIFFMIAGVFRAFDETVLTLPATRMAVPAQNNTAPQILIDNVGAVLVAGESQTIERLSDVIRELDNTVNLVVRADSSAPANTVIRVFSLARDAGFKEVGLQAIGKAESAQP